MPSFVHPALFWTLGLPTLGVIAIPVLIHLINMMRHRRIEWAAMEFLLLSQKKHRTWIIFKQLLLLLLRMLAVAVIVFMVAQPRLRNQWGLLGGVHTHHIVLLDDSYSMSDRWADTDAFAEARKVVEQIGINASREDHPQSLSLLRFSRAALPKSAGKPDMLKQPVNKEFSDDLKSLLGKLKVSQTAAGPMPALQAIEELLGDGAEEQRIVYLISDFRARQWNKATELRKELLRLGELGVDVRLINCVDRERPNLAIVSLSPAEGIRAAGVPWFMDLSVQNFGSAPVREVAITLSEDGHGRASAVLAKIPPDKMATKRFLVHFPNAGSHDVTARLPSDAVDADNHRYSTVDLPLDIPVLLIDGSAQANDARKLSIALSPGEPVHTGVQPQIEMPRFLSLKPLANFHAIDLTNISRLDTSAVNALEKYVSAGGGLAFFLGDRTELKFFNDVLYRDGEGLFPVPLAREEELLMDRLEPAPDLQVEDHFIFRVFATEQNPYLQMVTVRRYFALPPGWHPPADSTTRVVARLRNGAPLVVERQFGKGRVVAFLTSAAPVWNNWARNPSFVVVMQDLLAYLARRPAETQSRMVGSPLELSLNPALYQQDVQFIYPEQSAKPPVAVKATRSGEMLAASLLETDVAGFYEARLTRADGTAETRRYALNVDPAEGDLTALDGEKLAARLEDVKYRYQQAADFQSTATELAGYDLGEILLYGLILLLVGEQILAWSASYHPAKRHPLVKGSAA